MKRSRQELHAQSLAWIRRHPDATIHDVPLRLVQAWSYERYDDMEPSSFYLSIFIFGFCQHLLRQKGQGGPVETSPEEIREMFELWQIKLGLAELHHKTHLKFAAMPLFAFPETELLQVWEAPPN